MDGPVETVLALHGLGGNAALWSGFGARAAPRWRVLAAQAAGHGTPGGPAPFSIEDYADRALRLLDAHGLRRVHVLGLSMGGHAALTLYARRPERVASLVLANCSVGSPEAARERLAAARARIAELGFPRFARAYVLSRFGASPPQPAVDAYLESVLATGESVYLQALGAILAQDWRARLPQVRVPALVLTGAADTSTPPSAARELAAAIGGAQPVVLPQAGHFSYLDQPDAFADAVLGFLDRLPAAGRQGEPPRKETP